MAFVCLRFILLDIFMGRIYTIDRYLAQDIVFCVDHRIALQLRTSAKAIFAPYFVANQVLSESI